MPKYIDKDNLLQLFRDSYCGCKAEIAKGRNELDTAFTGYNSCMSLADNMPTADVQEVKHAKNLQNCFKWTFECSLCHWCDEDTYCNDASEFKFCPNCGAKIDLEDTHCCYAKGILCVYADIYGGCLCSACINQEVKQNEK